MYAIYYKDFIPESMLAKYPTPARYVGDELVLFCETQESVTGTPADEVVDVASMDLTNEQLQALVTQMLDPSTPYTPAEVQLSKAQGKWLYANDERFKPTETKEI